MTSVSVSMVNPKGRVVWVDEIRVNQLRDEGWRIIVNPKESYYPQYDQSQGRAKEDEIGGSTKVVENDTYGNRLGIIVIQ